MKTLKILLSALAIFIVIGFVYFQKTKEKQTKDNQWKVAAAFRELDLVFPTYFKIEKSPDPKEPDLVTIIETMNTVQSKGKPTRLEKNGSDVQFIPYEPMPYRIGKPDGPWQVVLIYEKEARKVRAEAYGDDLSKPVSVFEYPCCHW